MINYKVNRCSRVSGKKRSAMREGGEWRGQGSEIMEGDEAQPYGKRKGGWRLEAWGLLGIQPLPST